MSRVRRGEKFPGELRTHGGSEVESPGVVEDNERVERRLPPRGERSDREEGIPKSTFPRDDLTWTDEEGGASVTRLKYAPEGSQGWRGGRHTATTRVREIRDLTDDEGMRLYSVEDRPIQDDPAHAEISYEPKGGVPTQAERDQLLKVYRSCKEELLRLKEKDPEGTAKVSWTGEEGARITWRWGTTGEVEHVSGSRQSRKGWTLS